MNNSAFAVKNILEDGVIHDGAKSVVLGILESYNKKTGKIHLPTVTGTLAALLGEGIMRHCHPPQIVEAGHQYIRLELVADLVFKGDKSNPAIIDIMSVFIEDGNELIGDKAWEDDIFIRTRQAFGGNGMLPNLSVGSDYYPYEGSLNAQVRFRELVDFTSANYRIHGLDKIYMLAVGLGNLLEMSRDLSDICNDKKKLFQLAVEIAFGCAFMAPIGREIT